jgi:PAS domain S-box-containing protein
MGGARIRLVHQEICFVAPYERMRRMALEVAGDAGVDIDTFVGDLHIGAEYARSAVADGCRIVISRGGTARVIKAELEVPLVEIKVTGYDLLRVIYKYLNRDERIAVIGYDNVISGAQALGNILDFPIEVLPIKAEEEIDDCIRIARERSVDVVVGDTLAVRKAQDAGMGVELIVSGKEAVSNAVDEAAKIVHAVRRERENTEQLSTLLDALSEGVISIDRSGRVVLYNPTAEQLFGVPRENVVGRSITEVFPDSRLPQTVRTGQRDVGSVQHTARSIIAANRVPIQVGEEITGAVATFQDVTKIEEVEQRIRQTLSQKGLTARRTFDSLVGKSSAINDAIRLARRYATSDSTVLLKGESGTGKELFAQSMHNCSKRRSGPFVAVNCGAIAPSLLESELFGYAEGAFTGALRGGKKGLFELAHRGTLFLDEIGEIDIHLQAKILRVLQEGEVMRIGDDRIIPVDVRTIAATNCDLRQEVIAGRFRQDLFYRVNVLDLRVPPLRERREDIPEIAAYFARLYQQRYKLPYAPLSKGVVELFLRHSWPGNVRELANIVEKLTITADTRGEICCDSQDLLEALRVEESGSVEVFLEGTLYEIEHRIVRRVLEQEQFNKTRTAKRLGISRVTLNSKLQSRPE